MVKSVEESLKNEKKKPLYNAFNSCYDFCAVFFSSPFFCQNFGVNCFQITYIYTIDITAIVRGPR